MKVATSFYLKTFLVSLIGGLMALVVWASVAQASPAFQPLPGPFKVEIVRDGDKLKASTDTPIVGAIDSQPEDWTAWRWVRVRLANQCSPDLKPLGEGGTPYVAADVTFGEGSEVTLTADDAGMYYCFYVSVRSTQADPVADGMIRVTYPIIQLAQVATETGMAINASVLNAERDNITVDADSWQWYRFERITDSRFGCNSRHAGLDDDGLRAAAQRAQEIQQADGVASSDVYAAQKDVYKTGTGTTVDVNASDVGLTYCFRVADAAGIVNTRSIVVAEVPGEEVVAEEPVSPVDDEVVLEEEDAVPAGDTIVTTPEVSTDEEVEIADNSNLMRNIGIGVVVVALLIGVFMIVRRSQTKDDENQ